MRGIASGTNQSILTPPVKTTLLIGEFDRGYATATRMKIGKWEVGSGKWD
jgi:hypothetical protein